ncbi:alpha/beta hydrolase-fold protein [Pseudoalteromonas sp. APC 3358]|uniref:alpha/beta hydrolase-fold protein n=1 Tax=Pseudoalteromonas sp. APC 3358 TaxID=3035176 RepID=UPI0025B5D5C6|nr:alpha/beta hydrolase-fold protein [Pseudoalteromonas sp. APC 3358]MDN3384821.1 alpha/beta hydrolase-fold protein [Pseudoalteromonas sp. APC 3358]
MKLLLSLVLILTFSTPFLSHAKTNTTDITVGKKVILQSKILNEDRPIKIFIPDTVKDDQPLYVIYLLDGVEHFHTASGVIKSLVDYEQIPNAMLVGIDTTNRVRDYLPKVEGEPKTEFQTFVKNKWPDAGHTDKFLKFVSDELMPYINSNYSTNGYNTLIGHSNAGTLALYTLVNQPELFNNYIAISPNSWWSDEELKNNIIKYTKNPKGDQSLFISVASEGARFYTGVLNTLVNLEQQTPSQLKWEYKHYTAFTHMGTILPALSDSLIHLFNDLIFKVTDEHGKFADVSLITGYYQALSDKYGFELKIPQDVYVEFAHSQQKFGNTAKAITTLKHFTTHYPNATYSHMRLSQGYTADKQFKEAVTSMKHALELAKENKKDPLLIDALKDMVNEAQENL